MFGGSREDDEVRSVAEFVREERKRSAGEICYVSNDESSLVGGRTRTR